MRGHSGCRRAQVRGGGARKWGLEVEYACLKKMYAEERVKAEILNEAPHKKVVRPDVVSTRNREMAKSVVAERGISIRLACVIFSVGQTC